MEKNNFRRKSDQRYARQAIDGFISVPAGQANLQPQKKPVSLDPARRSPSFGDRLRATQSRPSAPRLQRQQDQQISARPLRSVRPAAQPRENVARDGADRSRRVQQDVQSPRNRFEPPEKYKKRRWWFGRRSAKKARKQHSKRRKWTVRIIIILIVLLVAVGGFLAIKGYLNLSKMLGGGGAAVALDGEVDPSKLKGEGDGRVNILLLGRGGAGHDGPDLTDTILVASIDPVNKKAGLVSVQRDLWVDYNGSEMKLNAVFANAKSRNLTRSDDVLAAEKVAAKAVEGIIEDVLGVQMHYYAMVDFAGFEKAVQTVGGVTIDVPEELRDPTMAWENKWNPVLAKPGVQKMEAKQALMYVRSRHGSAGGDFDRAERQRLFIMALKNEITSAGTYGNPLRLANLMDDFGDHVRTDFSVNDLTRLFSITRGISSMESIGLNGDPPHDYLTTGNYGGQSIVRPKAGLFDYSDIQKFIRAKLPDGYLIKEKAPIIVLNGTATEGFATEKADELKSYSYNVKKVANAPTQDYPQTVLVELGGDVKYTKNYLERRFKVKATKTLPEGITLTEQERKGFVIILGSNEITNR